MTALRNLNPIASTPAILSDHRLAFNIPGIPLLEPSSASVEPSSGKCVHGVLYKLTDEDFVSVCRTEGIPFSYTLHRCDVVPYTGDGIRAGAEVLESDNYRTVSAYTLRAGKEEWRTGKDIAPSRSYRDVILRGSREFELDEDYVKALEDVQVDRKAVGFSEEILSVAEMLKSFQEL